MNTDLNANSALKPLKILFLDKVLAGPCRRPPRGVELFNLNLLRDLAARKHVVAAGVHSDWQAAILEKTGPAPITLLTPPRTGSINRPLLWQANALNGRRFDILLLGNVANRLIPTLILLRLRRAAGHCVLIAHREPSRRSLWAQSIWPSTVIAVNSVIARHFSSRGFARTTVDYGITDAHEFFPGPNREPDGLVHFCVTGNLDNVWKGSDMAVRAFKRLPPAVRQRCRLHLASFQQPRNFNQPEITAYRWMPASEIPAFLGRMDVMIVPSRDEKVMRETFSQAMVQGMLTGLPIIATPLQILTEKLDRGGGLVAGNDTAMAAAIQRLAGDPALRNTMGCQARATALERYVWDTEKFDRLYLQPAARLT